MRSAIALLLLAAIAGCSTLPTAPRPAPGTDGAMRTDAPVSGARLPDGGEDSSMLPPMPPPLAAQPPVVDGTIGTVSAGAIQISPVSGATP